MNDILSLAAAFFVGGLFGAVVASARRRRFVFALRENESKRPNERALGSPSNSSSSKTRLTPPKRKFSNSPTRRTQRRRVK